MHNQRYHIERLNSQRLADVTLLHKLVYGRSLPADFFRHKYDTAYTEIMYIGFLAYSNNEPAAFYGVIPCFIIAGGQVVLAAQSADTMTHPNHRNQGLFVALAQLTYALCRAEGIKLLFGFPNQNSLPGFINKLGWQVIAQMQCFSIPVKALPLERVAAKLAVLQGWYKACIMQKLKKYKVCQNGIGNSLINLGYDGVHRNHDYLKYKTYNHTHTIKAGQATVWFKINNGLVIGDMAGFENNFDHLMQKLIKLAGKLGLKQIQFQVLATTPLHTLLLPYARPVPSFPVIVKDLDWGLPTDKLTFAFADIDIF